MQGERATGRYRAIDLTLFAIILAIFETIIVKAATHWFPREAWTVSAVSTVTAIVMVRWGPWCAIHAVLGGIITVLATGGNGQQYLIYGIGNLAVLAVLPLERKWGWQRLRKDVLVNFLFSALTVLSMQVGRAAVALAIGAETNGIWLFITADAITYIFTLAIIWIVSRLDGMLEDQRHYLNRLRHEPEQ